jgi:hypothetical protein
LAVLFLANRIPFNLLLGVLAQAARVLRRVKEQSEALGLLIIYTQQTVDDDLVNK